MCFVCPSWLSFILYNPVRKLLTDRDDILNESGITASSVVLEIGAGNGFLTEMIVRRARRVIAVELQEGMVKKLRKRIRTGPPGLQIINGDISLVIQDENIADVCLLYYSFHEVANKLPAIDNIGRMLKKGGLLAIYEPSVEVGKKAMETTISMFENAGFVPELTRHGIFTRFARLRKNV